MTTFEFILTLIALLLAVPGTALAIVELAALANKKKSEWRYHLGKALKLLGYQRVLKRLSPLALAFAIILSIGCESTTPAGKGIPREATLVGQGKNFIYTTPADGRIYRVREGKVNGFRLMRKGEIYRAIGPVEGDDPTKDFDDYEYYFEPAAMSQTPPPSYR